jgi:hypothetical protein
MTQLALVTTQRLRSDVTRACRACKEWNTSGEATTRNAGCNEG